MFWQFLFNFPFLQARGFRLEQDSFQSEYGLSFLGRFVNGQVTGNFWAGMKGRGFIHGKADDQGRASGPNISYIYPDGETAFLGHFENLQMKEAFHADVLEYGCDDFGIPIVKKFTQPLSQQVFKYEPCTNISIGGGAPIHVQDPYELKTVQMSESSIPKSGEGVFLKRDVPRHRFACMYSYFLYRRPDEALLYKEACTYNVSKSDDFRRNCKKYGIPLISYGAVINIPPEFDINPLPNLGPKVNHHFTLNNSRYTEIEHPRWGLIMAVMPNRDMKKGEELFTHYGYSAPMPFPEDYPWYFEEKKRIEQEKKLKKKSSNKKKSKTKK